MFGRGVFVDTIKVFEAFAGVGSQRMALRNIGADVEVVGICDIDRYAILGYNAIHESFEYTEKLPNTEKMYEELTSASIGMDFGLGRCVLPKNPDDIKKLYIAHKNSKNFGDISKVESITLPDMDLFTYSFPCQSISIQGKQEGLMEGSGTTSSLLWECKKIISAKKPKYLLMENVKNLVGKSHKILFDMWNFWLDSQGYYNYWEVMNAADYGVPQARERVIMVSIRKDLKTHFEFPDKIPLNRTVYDILQPESEVHDRHYVNIPNFKERDVSQTILTSYEKNGRSAKRAAEGWVTLVKVAQIESMSREQSGRVYSSDGLSPTLDTMSGGNSAPKIMLDKETSRIRCFTSLETWRLMGYSDEDYYKARDIGGLPDGKLYERAGNGIVVPVLEAVFRKMFLETSNNYLFW
jgi:DNA (cytosine-5)-methyltransferase 1